MGKPSRTNPARRHTLALVLALLASLSPRSGHAQSQSAAISLQLPSALAYDAQGNLYIAERGAHVIRKLAIDGTLTIVAGTGTQGFSGDNGPATAAQLDSPQGLALDSAGTLYIADTNNHRIRKLALSTGLITTIAGTGRAGFSGENAAALTAQLDTPTALAVDTAGNLYLADTRNQRVRRITPSGVISTLAGNGTQGLAGDNGPATSASIDSPGGLAVDVAGNIYVADTHNQRIRGVSASTGIITTVAGSSLTPGLPSLSGDNGPAVQASLALPRGLALDGAGNLYVADSAHQRIRRIAPDGTITTLAGQGTEAFAGDNAPATSASLDSPRSIALSPANQVTVADSGNSRVRQLDTSPVPQIQTIIGPGTRLASSALALVGPAATTYGSGSVSATLTGGASATGSVTFADSALTPTPLATVAFLGGSATLPLGTLSAGVHTITASYPGDGTHAAAQSQPLTVTVSPLAVSAAAQPVSLLYGQPIPAISGTIMGALPSDAGSLSATFGSSAGALSAPGAYPITATLTGPAARNYTLTSTSGALTISKAPTATVLLVSSSSPAAGTPVTLTFQAVSSTAGIPTGSITVLDGVSTLTQLPLAAGAASYTSSTFADGAHSLTATYSGDLNFLPSTSAIASLTVGSSADFTFASTASPAQSVPSGSTASFVFSITPQGPPLSSPITLAVSGLPVGATASLNPAYIPPGGAVTSFSLTVQTTKTLAAASRPNQSGRGALASAVLGPFLLLAAGLGRRQPTRKRFPLLFLSGTRFFAVLACITSATLASGCGNRVASPAEVSTAPTYHLTVTGTATSATGTLIQHAVTVTLQVL